MRQHLPAPFVLVLALASGCYDEGLNIHDLTGTVIVPKEAATREISRAVLNDDGTPVLDGTGAPTFTTQTVDDPRLIGPVYLGLYPSVTTDAEVYPAPPKLADKYALPYGGTTIGDFRFACLESLQCQIVSGRFVDWQGIVDWYRDTVGKPIKDAAGNEVTNGEYLRSTCYTLLSVTSDAEVRVTATEDRNDDGNIDGLDLDFVKNADGDYEAPFTIWQQEFFKGFQLWSFMDSPDPASFKYSTCDASNGFLENEYNQDFYAGTQFKDILNNPTFYIQRDDWVTSQPFTWDDPEQPGNVVIDLPIAAPGSVQ